MKYLNGSRLLAKFLSLMGIVFLAQNVLASETFGGADPQPIVWVGPSLGLLNSTPGVGVSVQGLFKADPSSPLFVGVETGVTYWGRSETVGQTTLKGSVTSIPVLVTAVYQFVIPGSVIQPYFGGGVGISITPVSASVSSRRGESVSGADTKVYFEGLLKPGLRSGNFFFEPKFGVLNDQLVFLPTAGMVFEL